MANRLVISMLAGVAVDMLNEGNWCGVRRRSEQITYDPACVFVRSTFRVDVKI